jgi:citrate synthase
MSDFAKGLEGIVAAETNMSFIDGQKGILEYVGIPIGELASKGTFEESVYLLWNQKLPKQGRARRVQQETPRLPRPARRHGEPADPPADAGAPDACAPHDDQRALDARSGSQQHRARQGADKALKILSRAPTIIAYFDRYRRGLPLVHPRQDLSFAGNFLYMLNGEEPTEAMTRAFDICMITHADHGLNNSTFAARVVISTLSDLYSALTAAIGSLRGPLHGGANEGVMKMLNEIPSVADAEAYVLGKLERKEKIMGFGHRVYKNTDPRATELKTLAKQLAADTGNMDLYEKSHAIEQVMEKAVAAKGIYPNVDFYSATTYHCIGLTLDLFTPMFALSRIAGWAGHILEQLADNRLYRPAAEYVGPHAVPYVPIEQR